MIATNWYPCLARQRDAEAEYESFGNVYLMRTGNRTDQPLRFPRQEVAMNWGRRRTTISFDDIGRGGAGIGLKVKNNTNCRIFVKPKNGTTPVTVYPRGEYAGKQDGYVDPCKFPNQVFKTVDGVDVTVEPDHDANTNGGPMQWFVGGWKDKDWQKQLHKKKDHGWDELFKKSDPTKCICCAQ